MKNGTIEKFGLRAIRDALEGSDVATARGSLSELVGAAVEISKLPMRLTSVCFQVICCRKKLLKCP